MLGHNGCYILRTFIRRIKKLVWFEEGLLVTHSVFQKVSPTLVTLRGNVTSVDPP